MTDSSAHTHSEKILKNLPDNTPVILGTGQCVERIVTDAKPPFSSPVSLAAQAATLALSDAGVAPELLDTIAVIRTFADAAKAWESPFGGSNNPPESVARRIGASPSQRVYSDAGGTEPLQVMEEMCRAIARGEKRFVLLTGAEAIANERYARRAGYEDNWREDIDAPLDSREYKKRFASTQELHSGMTLPAHYYGMIENSLAADLGHNLTEHQHYMAQVMAPFSEVGAQNPYSQNPRRYSIDELATTSNKNYAIATPYSKWLVAQDAVNQGAALVLTSIGQAKALGIDPNQWVFVQAYAQGFDLPMSQRSDPGRSEAMTQVLNATLEMAELRASEMAHVDIYSCFPCAVHNACEALELPTDGSTPLTITGGLPYFGGPGNNYTMHAVAEMVQQLRGTGAAGLVTANGGILSKHAAAVLTNNVQGTQHMDWSKAGALTWNTPQAHALRYCDEPTGGTVLSYTVIEGRRQPDLAVILGQTNEGERFLANSNSATETAAMRDTSPIGLSVSVRRTQESHEFELVKN